MEARIARYSTSLHKIMDQLDIELKQILQDWTERQPLPIGGKSRLLKSAAAYHEDGRGKPHAKTSSQANDLISWAMVYCVDRHISLARIVT